MPATDGGRLNCPLCEARMKLAMDLMTSRFVCDQNPNHTLSLIEWQDWVQDERSTASIMRLLHTRDKQARAGKGDRQRNASPVWTKR